MAAMAIKATYELDGKQYEETFEGKGTTHKIVKDYLRSKGAKKIRTVIVCKMRYT